MEERRAVVAALLEKFGLEELPQGCYWLFKGQDCEGYAHRSEDDKAWFDVYTGPIEEGADWQIKASDLKNTIDLVSTMPTSYLSY
jgi:hypothetical protein